MVQGLAVGKPAPHLFALTAVKEEDELEQEEEKEGGAGRGGRGRRKEITNPNL